jgi:hypothetical protein
LVDEILFDLTGMAGCYCSDFVVCMIDRFRIEMKSVQIAGIDMIHFTGSYCADSDRDRSLQLFLIYKRGIVLEQSIRNVKVISLYHSLREQYLVGRPFSLLPLLERRIIST